MNSEKAQEILEIDREDLMAVLTIRFGDVPADVGHKISSINEANVLERLILAAANAASWDVFLAELQFGKESFKLIGEQYNPLRNAGGGE